MTNDTTEQRMELLPELAKAIGNVGLARNWHVGDEFAYPQLMAIAQTCLDFMQAAQQSRPQMSEATSNLLQFARHAEGCDYDTLHGAVIRDCSCGYLEDRKAYRALLPHLKP